MYEQFRMRSVVREGHDRDEKGWQVRRPGRIDGDRTTGEETCQY